MQWGAARDTVPYYQLTPDLCVYLRLFYANKHDFFFLSGCNFVITEVICHPLWSEEEVRPEKKKKEKKKETAILEVVVGWKSKGCSRNLPHLAKMPRNASSGLARNWRSVEPPISAGA